MTMTGGGIAKLIEECGELTQVLGKRLAYYTTDEHPDGGPPLTERMEDEMGDVIAAIELVITKHKLDRLRIGRRVHNKLETFKGWSDRSDNNEHGIDSIKRIG